MTVSKPTPAAEPPSSSNSRRRVRRAVSSVDGIWSGASRFERRSRASSASPSDEPDKVDFGPLTVACAAAAGTSSKSARPVSGNRQQQASRPAASHGCADRRSESEPHCRDADGKRQDHRRLWSGIRPSKTRHIRTRFTIVSRLCPCCSVHDPGELRRRRHGRAACGRHRYRKSGKHLRRALASTQRAITARPSARGAFNFSCRRWRSAAGRATAPRPRSSNGLAALLLRVEASDRPEGLEYLERATIGLESMGMRDDLQRARQLQQDA